MCWGCHVNQSHVVVCVMSANNIGEEGAKALGPHLAKLTTMTTVMVYSAWRRCFLVMDDK